MCLTSSCSSSSWVWALESKASARLFYSTSISVGGSFLERSRSMPCILALRALAAACCWAFYSSAMRFDSFASVSVITLAPCLMRAISAAVRIAASRAAFFSFLSRSFLMVRSSFVLTIAMFAFVGCVADAEMKSLKRSVSYTNQMERQIEAKMILLGETYFRREHQR